MEETKKQKLDENNKLELATKSKSWHDIPVDMLMTKIIPRLPTKSLVRFKSISHEWFNTITTLDFAKKRLDSGSCFPQFLIPCCEGDNRRLLSLSYYDDNDNSNNSLKELVEMPCVNLSEYEGYFSVVDTCNGLLCLNLILKESFGIWNPATRQYEQILHPQQTINNEIMILQAEGFGYVSSTNDYKVFTMFLDDPVGETPAFYLFSFNEGVWRELDLANLVLRDEFCKTIGVVYHNTTAVCIGEKLFWVHQNSEFDNILGLFSFDLVREEMVEVTSFCMYEYNKMSCIFEMDGCLSISCCKNDQVNHIWSLEGEGEEVRSWVRLFCFDASNISLLGFTSSGCYLGHHLRQFQLVDPKKESADLSEGGAINSGDEIIERKSWHYVESFITFRIQKPQVANDSQEEMI